MFIFKDTEPGPLQDSFGVRQMGDLPGPPTRNPVCVCLLLQDLLQSCSRGGESIAAQAAYQLRYENTKYYSWVGWPEMFPGIGALPEPAL